VIDALPPRRPRGARPRTGPPRLLPDRAEPALPIRLEHVAAGQAGFYAVTGVWPILSMGSFEAVTGDKKDEWLVKTVGALIACVGGTLALAASRRSVSREVTALAVSTALTLAAADLIYVAKRRIRPVYLLDAAAEIGIVAAWLIALLNESEEVRT
jgi:hypothetical protein